MKAREVMEKIVEIIDKTPDANDPGLTMADAIYWDKALLEIHEIVIKTLKEE